MQPSVLGSTLAVLVLLLSDRTAAQAEDPLELRLEQSGLTDPELAATTEGVPHVVDVEIEIVSDPDGLGLRATRQLEGGPGVERRLCRAPCTTYLERGSYRFAVESLRGRRRDTPGTISLNFDGRLVLGIHSRRAIRAAWWTTTVALVGSGLSLYLTHRQAHTRDDPYCVTNCTYYTGGQRAAMTAGGLMVMFGGIAMRFGITARDTGVVHFDVSPRSRHVDPDEAP